MQAGNQRGRQPAGKLLGAQKEQSSSRQLPRMDTALFNEKPSMHISGNEIRVVGVFF